MLFLDLVSKQIRYFIYSLTNETNETSETNELGSDSNNNRQKICNLTFEGTMDRDAISEINGIDHVNTTETKYVYYTEKRHASTTIQNREEGSVQDWRMRERLKTISGALILCLNIGVDPPDVVKPSPCAKLECWVDPFVLPPAKALDAIGKNLQAQYEQLSIRTRYKQYLDPSVDEMKKFCTN